MSKKSQRTALAISSAFAGICNSLIGAGGGIIASYFLSRLCGDEFPDKRNIYATSQAAMLPGCVISCAVYSMRGSLDLSLSPLIALPAILGGLTGSFLLPRIKFDLLKAAFALLVIWSGMRMLIA